jgi:hypothetical protein
LAIAPQPASRSEKLALSEKTSADLGDAGAESVNSRFFGDSQLSRDRRIALMPHELMLSDKA